MDQENRKLVEFLNFIRNSSNLVVEELWDCPKAYLAAEILKLTGKNLCILTEGVRESRLFEDLLYFTNQSPLEFPAWDTLLEEDSAPSPDVVGQRYSVLRSIQETKSPLIILTPLQAVFQKVITPKRLEELYLSLHVGMSMQLEALVEKLAEMGYVRGTVASDKREFAVRGGIVDLFPVELPEPYRIEFWGDEIASIRKYDPIGQTSVEKVGSLWITPGEELNLLQEQHELATLFDYLGENTVVIFDDITALEDKLVFLKNQISKSLISQDIFFQKIKHLQTLYFAEASLETLSEVHLKDKKTHFSCFNREIEAYRWRSPFIPLLQAFCPPDKDLETFSQADFLEMLSKVPENELAIQFVCQSDGEEAHLKEQWRGRSAEFKRGYLSSGFYLEDPPFALVPMTELTHRYRVRRQKQRTAYSTLPVDMLRLTPGESIVHMQSGIGRFLGIEKRPNHLGIETEFMIVEYAEGAKLYVPLEQSHLISKYIGATDEAPKLHTLGSTRWARAREKTEQAIVGYAADLLQLQAERAIREGFKYPNDSDLYIQFENEFPYEETPDQKKAIQDVREDMLSSRPMDRLICGDVGYGKTEVAIRGAFKAVVDGGKQVAVLVPTTVLALQHYETFSERMANFPITIKPLSRFQKPKEIKEILQQVKEGTVDILIGTHRIISTDVFFKDLGLVIIDEEQRFGVRAKEYLKKIKNEVDCITLSATPIPRTLYMSLVGARDMSAINTPPEDRLPIQSMICQSSDELIKNALLRELARDGQAFFIHNRVETIYDMADKIRALVPEARVVIGHGQMSTNELDSVFHAFKSGQADILVATTIIENGIDIPNANTILIDRADRFGMADLYQMRGRVGRWNRKAYCYFLVSNIKELNEISRRRLTALTQSSGHGGGMKIALHDLEIRGAGNILGTEQSGHVATIGFHLYCKLLKRAIRNLKNKGKPIFQGEVKMEFPFDARLPENYVNDVTLRIDLYQRLGDAEAYSEIDVLMREIEDRFGPAPPEVQWLYHLTRIRLFAAQNHFTLLRLKKTILQAEQSHGKKKKIAKNIVIKPFSSVPAVFESNFRKILQSHFSLPNP